MSIREFLQDARLHSTGWFFQRSGEINNVWLGYIQIVLAAVNNRDLGTFSALACNRIVCKLSLFL